MDSTPVAGGLPPQPQFTPDMVYNLIRSSPQGMQFVESLAKMSQMQQVASQFGPQLQQFMQNPGQAMQNVGNWAQNFMAQPQQANGPYTIPSTTPVQPIPPPAEQPPQGAMPMNPPNNMMGMAMEIIGKFEATLGRMEEAQKQMADTVKELADTSKALQTQNKTLTTDLAAARKAIEKLSAG